MITSIQIQDLILNAGAHYGVTGVPGLESPPVRLASYDLAGQHRGAFVSALHGKRRFSITGWIVGDDVADFLDRRIALINACSAQYGEQPIVITLVGGLVLTISAVAIRIDAPLESRAINAGQFRVEFEASFPYLTSATTRSQDIYLATGGGGKVPPDTMPMGLSFGSGGLIYANNAGTAPAFPTARIHGPVTGPALRNQATGQEITLAAILDTGQYLDLDFRQHTITDETGRNRYDAKSGDWWVLSPGTSAVRFIADSTESEARVTLRWEDTYLGF